MLRIHPARLILAISFLLTYLVWILWAFDLVAALTGARAVYFGREVGNDFYLFHTVGRAVADGRTAGMYELFSDHPHYRDFGYNRPPYYALLFAPLAPLPRVGAFFLWVGIGIVALWWCIRLLGIKRRGLALAAAFGWFPVWCAVSFGQTTLPTLGIIGLTYWLWNKRRPGLAGLTLSLALDKPQVVLGVLVLWLWSWRRDWRALAGTLGGAAALGLLSVIVLPEATWAYLQRLPTFGTMMYQPNFPLSRLQTVDGFFYLLLRPRAEIAVALSLLTKALGLLGAVALWRRYAAIPSVRFSIAVLLTFWLAPYLLIYDHALLLIPGLLLTSQLRVQRWWPSLVAAAGLGAFLGWPLVEKQLLVSPNAVNVNVLVLLAGSAYLAFRLLNSPPDKSFHTN